jgi:hypothetical protein
MKRIPLPRWSLKSMFVVMTIVALMAGYVAHLRDQCTAELIACKELQLEVFESKYCGPSVLAPLLRGNETYWSAISLAITSRTGLPISQPLNEVLPQLETIGIWEISCDENLIENVSECKALAHVEMGQCECPPNALLALTSNPSIEMLSFDGMKLSTDELSAMASLPRLRNFIAHDCEVTEDGILMLIHSKSLEHLDVRWSNLEREFIDQISKMRPDLQVFWL